jgi:serine/threonine-protein kinase
MSALTDTLLWGTPYRARQRLGRGGMGEVVEAEHVALGKPVVVKLLHLDLNEKPHVVERMRVEAQALARLAHKNLVAVTDFGQTAEGRTYFVMERLYGRTLREELDERGPLPASEAVEYVTQALAGLAAAHGAGIVHRDVKLDNLFLCEPDAEGRRLVKVLDFGAAKVVAPGGGGPAPAPSRYETGEGILVGTPRYLSPEQACGRPVDARADVYAAGVVLYALLAGRSPFEHVASLLDLLRAHAALVPEPPSRHAPAAIPADLDRAVMRALEKDPDRRFPSSAAFAAELTRIACDVSSRASSTCATDPSLRSGVQSTRPRWLTTEPLAAIPPMPLRAPPESWAVLTEPLAGPPVAPARLAPTLPDLGRDLSGAVIRLRPGHSGGPPSRAIVPVLVVSALVLGFALAVLLRLGV